VLTYTQQAVERALSVGTFRVRGDMYDAEQSSFRRRHDHLLGSAGAHSRYEAVERFVGAHGGGAGSHDVFCNGGRREGRRDRIDASENDSLLVHDDDRVVCPQIGEDGERLVGQTRARFGVGGVDRTISGAGGSDGR